MEHLKQIGKNTFISLSIRNYRLYFIGQAISLSGTWMQTIAQGLLVLKLTNSGTILGFITALQFLPILLFGPYGGLIADRFPKQKILFFTQSTAGILALILSILVGTHLIQLWMVGVLAFSLGLVNLIDNPTRQTFLPEMVNEKMLPNTVTLNSWEINLTRVIGPSLAGIVAATLGLTLCFFLNSISYIAVLVVLFMMNTKVLHPSPISQKKKGQLKEGFAYVRSNPLLRNTLLMLALVGTLTYEFPVILPLLAQFTFHNLDAGYAALTAAMGFGAVIGGLFTANKKNFSTRMLIYASLFFGLSMVAVAISPSLPIAVLSMFLVGASSINFNSIGNVTLQLESIPEMRGRVMSLWTMAFLGSTPIGGPLIGWVGQYVGPRFGVGIGAAAAFAAAGIGMLTLPKTTKGHVPLDVEIADRENRSKQPTRIP